MFPLFSWMSVYGFLFWTFGSISVDIGGVVFYCIC